MIARWAPLMRMRRVTARVSMPVMPATLCWAIRSPSDPEARQFDTRGDRSRTTKPAHQGRADSKSSGLTPTLPISGAVISTICPR
jgi:hypothetical protein